MLDSLFIDKYWCCIGTSSTILLLGIGGMEAQKRLVLWATAFAPTMTCISPRQWDMKKAQGWSLNYLNGCWVEITEDSGHPSLSKPAAQSTRLRRRRARGDVDNNRNVATTRKPENKSGKRVETAERSGRSDSDLQRGGGRADRSSVWNAAAAGGFVLNCADRFWQRRGA